MAGPDIVLRMPASTNNNNDKSKEEEYEKWRKLSLMQKWKNHYHGGSSNPMLNMITDRLCITYFLFIATTELYVALSYVIPWYYEKYNPTIQYSLKVLSVFVFIQSIANWLCLKFTRTSLEKTDDRPDPANRRQQTPETEHISMCMHDNEDIQPLAPPSAMSSSAPGVIKARPTFSWDRCTICQLDMPPRTHHCKSCNKCILKRDHHCYMTGICVGFWNQRFFVIMNFYITIASFYGLLCIYSYVRHHTPEDWRWTDYFLPNTIWKWLWGQTELQIMYMTFHLYTLWWTGAMAIGFFIMQLVIIYQGKTLREFRKNLRIKCTATPAENFRSVFGSFWGINFLFPAQLIFKQPGDGKHWSNIRTF